MDFIYIGWGLKQDSISYSSSLTNALKIVSLTDEDLTEYQELTNNQVVNFKHNNLRKQYKKKIFSFNNNENKESEKVITDYNYE